MSKIYTCGGCPATWDRIDAAHCSACHETFSSVSLFDVHRSQEGDHGTCLNPETIETRDGHPRMFYRGGRWTGPPLSQQARERLVDIANLRGMA